MQNKHSSLFTFHMLLMIVLTSMTLSSCYNRANWQSALLDSTLTVTQRDSISFIGQHHYGINYNFIITADSINLIRQLPDEYINNFIVDTITIEKNQPVVVADFRTIPSDSIDSVWVKVAGNETRIGWIHESDLRESVVPDDPISQFIDLFSDIHLIIFLIVVCLIGSTYIIVKRFKRKEYIVHFNDIPSFYPSSLALMVAISATLYSTIQIFASEAWQEFYYHPTLNPFITPPLLCTFLITVWLILVLVIASVDDVFHLLRPSDAILYLLGLMAVCAINYTIFTFLTLYFIGYFVLAAYIFLAIYYHIKKRIRNFAARN